MSLPKGAVELQGHVGWVRRIVPLPDGELVVTAGNNEWLCVCSAATGALLRTPTGHRHGVDGLAALGGDVVASGDWDGVLRVWNARTGECTRDVNLGGYVYAIAALDAGRFIASVGTDLFFFEHCDGHGVTQVRQLPSAHNSHISDIAACGGRFATASTDKTAVVWDVATLERLAVLDGHTDEVRSIAMDERWIVTGSWDKTARVFDARTFECTRVLENVHTDWVRSVAIVGADHALSASRDGTVCVSDLSSGALVAGVQLSFDVFTAAVTRNGRIAVAGLGGCPAIFPAPVEAAAIFRAHAAAASTAPAVGMPASTLARTAASEDEREAVLRARRDRALPADLQAAHYGKADKTKSTIDEAIACYEGALSALTREADAVARAATTINLGLARGDCIPIVRPISALLRSCTPPLSRRSLPSICPPSVSAGIPGPCPATMTATEQYLHPATS
jgi:WD40 repeat protein